MAKRFEVYKCAICGNIVEVLHGGVGELVCCGQPMDLQVERTQDGGYEKHVPVVEAGGAGTRVKVGSTQHPMEEKHLIQWIEAVLPDRVIRHYLKPGEVPAAEFCVQPDEVEYVREYCNLHGLWRAGK